ncbi:kinase-like domain-containing protein [Tanacetum coccineum]
MNKCLCGIMLVFGLLKGIEVEALVDAMEQSGLLLEEKIITLLRSGRDVVSPLSYVVDKAPLSYVDPLYIPVVDEGQLEYVDKASLSYVDPLYNPVVDEGQLENVDISVVDKGQLEHVDISVVDKGQLCYVDPLYMQTGMQSEIYSFGVILFELLCARLAVTYDEDGDPLLRAQMNRDSIGIFSEIAYRCLNENPSVRPTILVVIEQLQKVLKLQQGFEILELQQVSYCQFLIAALLFF